jgi:hypothetical protein
VLGCWSEREHVGQAADVKYPLHGWRAWNNFKVRVLLCGKLANFDCGVQPSGIDERQFAEIEHHTLRT